MTRSISAVLLLLFVASCRCKDNGPTNSNLNNLPDVLLEKVLLESFVSAASPTATAEEQQSSILFPNVFESRDIGLTITERDIGFYLYTRRQPSEPVALEIGDSDRLRRSGFNSQAPTKILIHGWTDTGSSPWMHDISRNYLSVADYNVVIVDWASGSFKEYLVSARLAKQVGDCVSRLLEFLLAEGAIASLESVHLLGHSLGAHIAGLAGSNLSGRIGRITGMDPARPDFEAPLLREPRDRLDPSDARFVDVIHTCAGTAGFVRPTGHADFYPNGGSFRQPGCPVLSTQYCSHGRSYQFMGESIVNPMGFPAVECFGWKEFKSGKCDKSRNRVVYMGEQLDSNARGVFFLETNAESPFGRAEL